MFLAINKCLLYNDKHCHIMCIFLTFSFPSIFFRIVLVVIVCSGFLRRIAVAVALWGSHFRGYILVTNELVVWYIIYIYNVCVILIRCVWW